MTKIEGRLDSVEALGRWQSEEILALRKEIFQRPTYNSATFDPAESEGFSRVDTSTGILLVSLEDVRPFADGQKVTLSIGNPTTAILNGIFVTAKWGPREPELDSMMASAKTDETKDRVVPETDPADMTGYRNWAAAHDAWEKGLRTKVVEIPADLRPGQWNKVSVVLPATPSDEFGYLDVGLKTERLSLAK